jgi:UrcA family protein
MRSNNTAGRRENSIFNTQSLKESVMIITKAGGKNALRMTWAMLAAVSITMLADATQAAESGDTPPQQVVSFKDLKLTSSEGIAVLYRRIQSAANNVCGKADTRDLARMAATKACVDRAISQGVAAVNNPMLTSLYLAKTGRTEKQLVAIAQPR